ncbi:hypothetical protein G7054_g5001 [Neopestalotiopsis clavispora]|nr:hypothetical protein G7054_g5001 [Neopestalotiopsis clavispora]
MLLKPSHTLVSVYRLQLLRLLGFCFLALLVTVTSGKISVEVERLYKANAQLLAEGQLVLDLFPPLSYFLTAAVPVWVLHHITLVARLFSVCAVLRPTRFGCLGRSWWVAPTGAYMFLLLHSWQQPRDHGAAENASSLEASTSIATYLLLLSLLCFADTKGPPRLTWARQVLVILAGMLGCNLADWLLSYAAVTAQEFRWPSLLSQPPGRNRLAWQMTFAILRVVGLPLFLFVAVYGLLSPFSETATGNNHNLRFLDASTRRALSPQRPVNLETLDLEQHAKHVPKHAIIPFLPLSLYVPNAGFLWGDTNHDAVSPQVQRTGEPEMSAYFSDPFGKRYPWALEQPDAHGDEGLNKEQRSFVQSHLCSKAFVYLRSRIDHMYLGTASFLQFEDQDEDSVMPDQDSFLRFPLGLHAETSPATVWILDYDPTSDNGFRLYNPDRECHLATTFRPTESTQNSTAHDESSQADTQLIFEAACTRGASTIASTFWVIEGRLEQPDIAASSTSWRKRLPQTVEILADTLQRGYVILRAHASLYIWNNRFEQHLELMPSPLSFSKIPNTWETWLESERARLV